MTYRNIFDLITAERNAFIKPAVVIEGWNFSLKQHIKEVVLYKNSQFVQDNDLKKSPEKRTPFKNIIRFILNTHYRTEGFNVSDIEFFTENSNTYWKSLFLRKFHEKWALENQIDSFIDKLVESFVDYGAALIKNVKGVRPEVVELSTLAFCNQKDILSRPFGIRHMFSIDELMEMSERGWGETSNGATVSLDEFLILAEKKSKVYGGDMEIFEVHGVLPEKWIDSKQQESKKYIRQVQIVAFYVNEKKQEVGVTLFKSRSPKQLFKLLKRDEIPNRCVGFGGVEELTDAQIWTNYAEVRKKDFMDSASKTLLQTTDSGVVNRHPTGFKNLENLEVIQVAEGKAINQVDTFPRNLKVFDNSVREWENYARMAGFANEPLTGEPAPSGTPFRAQAQQILEGKGIHEYRKEKIARFVEQIYREWIIPQLKKELVKEQQFLAEFSSEELEAVAEELAENQSNKQRNEEVLNLQIPSEKQELKQKIKSDFLKPSLLGNKRTIKMLENELSDDSFEPRVDIAGKVKNLGMMVDKLSSVFRTVFQNPAILQDPRAVKLLDEILEHSGFSPLQFSYLKGNPPQPTPIPAPAPVPAPAAV